MTSNIKYLYYDLKVVTFSDLSKMYISNIFYASYKRFYDYLPFRKLVNKEIQESTDEDEEGSNTGE